MIKNYILLLFLFSGFTIIAQSGLTHFADNVWGVYTWGGPRKFNIDNNEIKGVPLIIRWNEVEPVENDYKFNELITPFLKRIAENNCYTFLKLWVSPFVPRWVYEKGVPEVFMTKSLDPLGRESNKTFPYYFSETYIKLYYKLILEFGNYIQSLPPDLQKRILFIQSAEGSTGDGGCYKGKPLDSRFDITKDEWGKFRIKAWETYKNALSGTDGKTVIPLLVNFDANGEMENKWLLDNLNPIGLKKGDFSHGYHISDEISRLESFRKFVSEANDRGITVFSRGEQDAEWKTYGWSTQNLKQAVYWSAIHASFCGLDMWNFPYEGTLLSDYNDAFNFFNKYANQLKAENTKYAYCVFRKGLNAADTVQFPEKKFGKATRNNVERYMLIANKFSNQGAKQGDPEKAIGGMMINRKSNDYNDVGWNIFTGNYEHYLNQIDADSTTVGHWNIDKSIYGRFGRGFENETNKKNFNLKFDNKFFFNKGHYPLKVIITYLDKGFGSWSFDYQSNSGFKTAETITNKNSGTWIKKNIYINDFLINLNSANQSDFVLKYIKGDNTLFHAVEIEREN